MNVQELIEKLQLIEDKSIPVVTSGFDETGIDLIDDPEEVEIYLKGRSEIHDAEYELVESYTERSGKKIIKACYISF